MECWFRNIWVNSKSKCDVKNSVVWVCVLLQNSVEIKSARGEKCDKLNWIPHCECRESQMTTKLSGLCSQLCEYETFSMLFFSFHSISYIHNTILLVMIIVVELSMRLLFVAVGFILCVCVCLCMSTTVRKATITNVLRLISSLVEKGIQLNKQANKRTYRWLSGGLISMKNEWEMSE